ncbi:AHL_G0013830.mRNA.1.CDS.1 [Saccharomyces cerevisiae]|nr:CPG_1a_G0052880.mRNA.1.CDS.1 [Saccharomyces cerevisiae]CAI4870743.1 AHL_G0006590.mRNA.1.CDS.1 [Saccharomyces cerevisiae]CAI4877699.1 AHL_G0013830.mRNA.1.CDS.1 [Saccharomyces cerevisiae]CAI6527287.1 AHL_G0006590.mRNA.1.CDS.1 [Saccharomyces cerevisiae]CAI6615008.1 AHL_G0013830.mRNA.1.CDS.1 [Saccharomyces cerevisiae]
MILYTKATSHSISTIYTTTSPYTALASAVYTLCHLPITPTIIHILISITDHTTSIII